MLTKEELDQVNRFSKAELTADQVYTFSVRLCDNEVDRGFERFGTEDLERLGELFLGKSGIFDHQWSAKGQTARIYRTEVVREPGTVTAAGDEYCWLKAWAYLMRTEKNQELIHKLKSVKKSIVSKELRGDDWEDMQSAVKKLEEVVTYINDCTGRGIYFE